MSVHVSSWVWKNTRRLPPGLRIVLLKVADGTGDSGDHYPSFATIAEECGKSRRQVIDDIKELVRLGLLVKDARTAPNGRTRSNSYRVVMDDSVSDDAAKGPEGGCDTPHPRVKPTAPSQGATHRTGGVKPTALTQCDGPHPPKSESSVEPSIEPFPPNPPAGGDGRSASRDLKPTAGTAPDPEAIDRMDAELADEEKRFHGLMLTIRDCGEDVQEVLDSLPRHKARAPFSARHWLATGRSGIAQNQGGLIVLRLVCDALEARARAAGVPVLSEKNRSAFDAIDRVVGMVTAPKGPRRMEGVR